AGQLDPRAAWAETLGELQHLAYGDGDGSAAGRAGGEMARDLLGGWRVPIEEGAAGVGRWLQSLVDQAATPLEAKLARPLPTPDQSAQHDPAIGQDVRARLDTLTQTLA